MFRFERLTVWQKAVEIFELVDALADRLPRRGHVDLADQIRRAALSTSSNIAEGSGRETAAEMRHFYTNAKGSTCELVSLSIIAEEIAEMLTALKKRPGSVAPAFTSRH